jgi:hypothetical protein
VAKLYWANNYWGPNYWPTDYWGPETAFGTGQHWAVSYWSTDYWNSDYWSGQQYGGELVADSATVAATVEKTVTGVSSGLIAGSSEVAATTGVTFEDIGTPAELESGEATLVGVALVSNLFLTINLSAGTAQATGAGDRGVIGSGTLTAGSAAITANARRVVYNVAAINLQQASSTSTGVGERLVRNLAAIPLIAGQATASGTGNRGISGTGVLVSASASTPGSVGNVIPLSGEHLGTGTLQSAEATVASTTQLIRQAQGALEAAAATIALEFTSNTPQDISEILYSGSATVSAQVSSGRIQIWDEADYEWGQSPLIHGRDYPMLITDNIFFQGDVTGTFDREPVEVVLERIGLTLMGRDRQGNWKVDPSKIKFISGIWPVLRGLPGTQVKLFIGSQENTEDPVDWEGPYVCTIGETNFIDFTVSGRYIALRFESTGQEPWELISYDLELTTVGAR